MENNLDPAQFFLSTLSHEIRTPLNGIVGYTQLLLHTNLNNTQKSYLSSMSQCCLQLTSLINDILDLSKLSTGKMPIKKECFSISEIVDELNFTLEFQLKEKEIKLRFKIDKNLPEYIVTDKNKLIQVLLNLITNSIKFTEKKGRIIVTILQKDFSTLEFFVEDNGVGISVENQKKLFTPFFQVEETKKGGSGLGLAISKKIVELLNGEIFVESDKGFGSIFSFFIKFENFTEYEKEIKKKSKILKEKYVLILDDNVDDRLSIGEILFDHKASPIISTSFKEAANLLEKNRYPFSIVLVSSSIDLETCRELKKYAPEIPFVFLYTVEKIVDMSLFETMIKKPVNKIKLIDSLIRVITKDSLEDCILNDDEEVSVTEDKELSILIAEDISYNSELLTSMLQDMGYNNVEVAENGEICIEKMREKVYDILLLDLKMPKKDGFEVMRYIKENDIDIRTAVLTASVIDSDRIRCKEMGVRYFILKPINMIQLKLVMKRLCMKTEERIKNLN